MGIIKSRSLLSGGLEYGTSGAKLVVLSSRHSMCRVESVCLEEETFEARFKNLSRPPLEVARKLLIQRNFSGCKVVFTAKTATHDCFVILPKMEKKDAVKALLLRVKKTLAWEDEEPALFAHTEVKFLRERRGYLAGMAQWNVLKPWCRLIEGCGAVADDITVWSCAYQALAARQGWAVKTPVFLVADFGAVSSRLYFFNRNHVSFLREIQMGGDTVTKALTTGISTASGPIRFHELEAEEVKARPAPAPEAGPPGTAGNDRLDQVQVMMRPAVERLCAEVARSIQYFKENTGLQTEAVFITGGTAGLPLLKSTLETTLALPVKVIDPFDGMSFAGAAVQKTAEKQKLRLAPAVGLALARRPAISLLEKSVQVTKHLTKSAAVIVAALLLALFLPLIFAGVYQAIKISALKSEIEIYRKELNQTDANSRRAGALQAQVQKSREYYETLQKLVGRDPLWPGVLNAIAAAIPADAVLTQLQVNREENQADIIILEGGIQAQGGAFDHVMAEMLSALGASVFFKQVNVISSTGDSTDGISDTFKIQSELVY